MASKKIIFVALLLIGLGASLFVAAQRVRVEMGNRAVEIVVDYDEISDIAAATGKTPTEVLRAFKDAGARSVAITEMTFKDAVDEGLLVRRDSAYRYDVVSELQGGDSRLRLSPYWGVSPVIDIHASLPMSYIERLPVGFPESALTAARVAGMEVVARLVNYPGATPESINRSLADVKDLGVKTVIFQGDQVLGFKGATKDTAAAIRRSGLLFGKVEFSKQKGEFDVAKRAPENVIIVHSITQNEMPLLDMPSVIERFTRGVRERGVRMCYVRMYDTASANLLGSNVDYVGKIGASIERAGYGLKGSRPLVETKVPSAMRVLAGAGVAAGAMLLILAVVDLSVTATVLWAIAAIVGCAGLAAFGDTGRKVVALLSAMVFPTVAAIYAVRSTPESPTAAPKALMSAIWRMVVAVATVACGGLLIVGLLSSRDFMLRINQFMGIKAAHLLPVLVLALLFTGGIAWKSDTWTNQKRRLVERFREIGSNPILLWQAAGMLAALVIVGMMVVRSGNDGGLEVSALELKFRSILDKVLYVRPRTKEFLIGYPMLLVGIAFALRGRRQWAAPLVAVGSIGLVSALNTFCHIHTPLALSVVRVVNGVVVGGIIGAVAYRVVRYLPGREGK